MDFYNHTRKLFANGEVQINNLKVVLLNDTYTFSATETALTAINAAQVSGNGWTAGGIVIANAAVTAVTANAKLDGDDISIDASGGFIGPAEALVIIDATNSVPLFYFEFANIQTAAEGTQFKVTFDASGIATFNAAV
jgi:hypothetical protein